MGELDAELRRAIAAAMGNHARKRRFAELGQHLIVARRLYQKQKDQESWLFPSLADEEES